MKREVVIPVEDLPHARCIHMLTSSTDLWRRESFFCLIAPGNRAEKIPTYIDLAPKFRSLPPTAILLSVFFWNLTWMAPFLGETASFLERWHFESEPESP